MKILAFILIIGIYFIPDNSIRSTVIYYATSFWFIFTLMYIIYTYYVKDKEYEIRRKVKYSINIPMDRTPELLGFLVNYNVEKEHLISVLMDMIRKGTITVGRLAKNNDIILVDNKKYSEFLSKPEIYLRRWLFDCVGNGENVSLGAIKKEAKYNSGYFYCCYKEWCELVNLECARYGFFENKIGILNGGFVYFTMSYIFFLYNIFITHNYLIGYIIFIITTSFLIYMNRFYRRTKEANREYEEWMSFKRYIKKEHNSIFEYDIKTIGLIAVYSKILKTDKEIKRTINKKYEDDKEGIEKDPLLYSIKLGVMDEIINTLDVAIKKTSIDNILFTKNHGNLTIRKTDINSNIIPLIKK